MGVRDKDMAALLRAPPGCVLVSVESVKGSTPRDTGAFMLVTADSIARTIGGGQLEFMAIDRARQMLRDGIYRDQLDIPLGPEIGQCCGGRVLLGFQRVDDALAGEVDRRLQEEDAARPHVYIFGAGHVGNALTRAFKLLPVRAILVDTRRAELEAAPEGAETRLTAVPEDEVRGAPAGSAFLILTHDHALDFLIVREALAREDAAYVGMIGSKSKRATFMHWFEREGGGNGRHQRLICPIGGTEVRDKRPEVIAALVAAEVLTSVLGHSTSEEAAFLQKTGKTKQR